jgi:hypothetical protein
MDQRRRVSVVPNGQPIRKGTLLIIEEDEDLDSFIVRASKLLWKGKKTGIILFFSTGMEILEIGTIREGDTLYISEGEDWIGMTRICCFPLPY